MTTIIQKIKEDTHKPLDFTAYNSSKVQENTNYFSHLIGTTVTDDPSLYRFGMISGKKQGNIPFFSSQELKEAFIADLEIAELKAEELALPNKAAVLQFIEEGTLEENQHLGLIFIQKSRDRIFGEDALRYDPKIGWSRKRFNQCVCVGKNVTWPANWYDKLIGVYKFTH